MCADHRLDGMKGPLIFRVLMDGLVRPPARRATHGVLVTPLTAMVRRVTAGVHRDRRIAAVDPHFHPMGERRPAAAMDEDDAGDWLFL